MILPIALCVLPLLMARSASATVHYVAVSGSSLNNGLSWSTPKADLNAVIAAASPGDQVWVKTGTYTANSSTGTDAGPFAPKDGVALYGGFAGTETSVSQRDIDANPTILDGSSNGSVIGVPGTSTGAVLIDGFTLRHGTGTVIGDFFPEGGGIYDSAADTLDIADCTFTANSVGSFGGGIYLSNTVATISGCTFTGNSAGSQGGGVYNSGQENITGTATITGCTFTGNSAEVYGGAVLAGGASTIKDCVFGGLGASDANTSQPVYYYAAGTKAAPAVIKDCLVIGTGATSAHKDGIDVDTGDGNISYVTIANDTIVNSYVGINLSPSFGSSDGAITVANNVIYGCGTALSNSNDFTFKFTSNSNTLFDDAALYVNEKTGTGDAKADPMFVDAATNDYRLAAGSECINSGNNTYVASGDTDLDGNPRIQNGTVDRGCYETTQVLKPTITSFTPSSGPVGTVITITGTGLSGATAVRLHDKSATTFSANAAGTQLTVTVPSGAAKGTITVTTPGGSVKTATAFTVTTSAN